MKSVIDMIIIISTTNFILIKHGLKPNE